MSLAPITDDRLAPFRHGFYTRAGGVSQGAYRGLNCGAGSDDQPGDVARNRSLVAADLGVDAVALLSLHQTHSTRVVHVAGPFDGPNPKADAMVTAQPGLALGALSADCQPVLFADRKAGVVGAAHAGWKGALSGVLEATVSAMAELGARPKDTVAIVGPCISQGAYEVGPEFRDRFLEADSDSAKWFTVSSGDRLKFDLPGYGLKRLRAAGVGIADWTGHCTYRDPERFFSYRYGQHHGLSDYGRLIAAIRI